MNQDLERFEHEWHHGDRGLARDLAKEYVAAHPAVVESLAAYTLEDIVRLIDQYRELGRESDRIVADMYLLATYPPQMVAGAVAIGGGSALVEAVNKALVSGDPL